MLINTVESKFKFRMKIPDTKISDAINQSAGYKYYEAKKAESEKGNTAKEPEEQHVSPVKSGRGKGYMRLGDQEVNVSSAFKKNVVPKKQRSIIVADNLVPQEDVAVELAKSVSIKERQLQQRDLMTQLTIERQIEKYVEDTYAEWGQKLKGPATEDPVVQSLLDLRRGSKENSDVTRDSLGSDTDQKKEDETDDSDDSDMDLSDDEPKGDDDVAGYGVFMYNKSTEPLKSTYLSPTVMCSSLWYIQSLLNEKHVHELTNLMSNQVYTNALQPQRWLTQREILRKCFRMILLIIYHLHQKLDDLTSINVSKVIEKAVQAKVQTEMKKLIHTHVPKALANYVKPRLNNSVLEVMKNNQISLFTKPSTTIDDILDMELKLKLLNIMYLNKSHKTHNTHQQLYNTLYQSINLDQEALDAQDAKPSFNKRLTECPNARWFTKKSGLADVANRRTTWFDLLLKSYIDQIKDHIIGPSTIAIANKLKELNQKDELTIADLEGACLEKLKKQYKNDGELEYHVDQLKASMLTEAQWNSSKGDVSKPRSFERHMFKSTKPIQASTTMVFTTWSSLARERSMLHLSPSTLLQEINNMSLDKVYFDKRIISFVRVDMKRKWGYGFLSSIIFGRSDKKEYEFSYADLPGLSLNDIEDMYLLKLRVESYQRTLNLTKPKFHFDGIDEKIPYIVLRTKKGVMYLNQHNFRSLMKLDEVHKFYDGTLMKIRDNLIDMVNKNELGRVNKRLKGRD
ncbi:hypothetical protein Tco_0260771 [Tanacetum coccineum]